MFLRLEMTCLINHFDDGIKVRSRGKNKDREKARAHCIFHCFILFHIVSYCFILFQSAKILEMFLVSVCLSGRGLSIISHSHGWPRCGIQAESLRNETWQIGIWLGLCALNFSHNLGPYPPTVIVSWQIVSYM